MKRRIHIGCSGYAYPAWNGDFFPEGLKPAEKLAFYSKTFDTTEINSTFYHYPKAATLLKRYEETPEDFRFSLKVNKQVTHIARLKGTRQSNIDFQSLAEDTLREKLLAFLFQLPPSFKYSDENLDLVLENIPAGKRNVVEFRDSSWWNEKVFNALKEHNITICNINSPKLSPEFVSLTHLFYLRMHGNPVMFTSSYSDERLLEISRQVPENATDIIIYFNNTITIAAIENARKIQGLLTDKQ